MLNWLHYIHFLCFRLIVIVIQIFSFDEKTKMSISFSEKWRQLGGKFMVSLTTENKNTVIMS